MSTYSASKAIALAQSAEEGAALSGRPLSLPISFPPGGIGVFASLAWVAFGVACLWWPDIGDWSRTRELAIAAFILSGAIFVATVAGSRLGRFDAGLQRRGPSLLGLGVFLDLWGIW